MIRWSLEGRPIPGFGGRRGASRAHSRSEKPRRDMMLSGVSELDCRSRRGPKRPSRGMRVDVAAWLRGLGLEQYVPLFRDNAIDAEVLPELSDADFEKLRVPLGHRK